jgi:hypothetical protein
MATFVKLRSEHWQTKARKSGISSAIPFVFISGHPVLNERSTSTDNILSTGMTAFLTERQRIFLV